LDYPKQVDVFEVCPRDGLQNEPEYIPAGRKLELIRRLVDAGCRRIEVTSFVHPKWVPQMKDAKEVFHGIQKKPGVVYNALIPNLRGLELAIETGLEEVVTIMSASESHNRANLNMSVYDSLAEIEKINRRAAQKSVLVRSYIATSFGCPMEGVVPMERVADIALKLESYGAYEISLGDTTGMADPISAYQVPKLIRERLNTASLAVHFHQFNGLEFANVLASIQAGVTVLDSAAGGLGGCPYAPGATGNIATETIVEMLERMGIDTGIDRRKIADCGAYARSLSAYSCMGTREGKGK